MTTRTPEQELQDLVDQTDYLLLVTRAEYGKSVEIAIRYTPAFRREAGFVTNTGEFARKKFKGRRKWKRALAWTRHEIEGHRSLVSGLGSLVR